MNVQQYRQAFAKTCPRVELDAHNGDAAELAGFLVNDMLSGLAPALFEALTDGDEAEDRLRILYRVAGAFAEPRLHAILNPPAEDASA